MLSSTAAAGLAGQTGVGQVLRDPLKGGGFGPEMMVVPAGSFLMGDQQGVGYSNEAPVHEVVMAKPFAVGRFEVTFEQYDRFCFATDRPQPPDGGKGRGRNPVIYVSWDDARGYTRWLSAQTGVRYRLPSEAEWEYAARAGTQSSRFWGERPEEACRFANVADTASRQVFPDFQIHDCTDGYPFTAPVGSFEPNRFGLYDMLGNVWEWCVDNLSADYHGAPGDGRAWKTWSENRVRRGGSWFSVPRSVRSAVRNGNPWGYRENETGFRVVRELGGPEPAAGEE